MTAAQCICVEKLIEKISVVLFAMATCPFCRQGALRMIAAITQAELIRKILCHLKRTADPPLIAPARARQATFDWVA